MLAVCCIAGLSCAAAAAEVDCDSIYCFSAEDFSGETPIAGICITSLPDKKVGTVMLGERVLVPGDVLTAEQAAQMTLSPRLTELETGRARRETESHELCPQRVSEPL